MLTYPEDVLKAAREAAAQATGDGAQEGSENFVAAAEILPGKRDWSHQVQAACIAIMAERQRCHAGFKVVHDALACPTMPRQSCGEIAATWMQRTAILGQQEGA